MKLDEFEEEMIRRLGELTEECKDICGEEGAQPILRLVEGIVYEGCDRCVIRTLIDRLGIDAFSISYTDGRYGEFVFLETHIIEITDENAQIIPIEDLEEYLKELQEFGLINQETVKLLLEWISSRKR